MNSMTRTFVLLIGLSALGTAPLWAQAPDQAELARQLAEGTRDEMMTAATVASTLGPDQFTPGLRAAIITALDQEATVVSERRRGDRDYLYAPTLIARIAGLAVELRDPRTIPGLVVALGVSRHAIEALAQFGEPAAVAILEALTEPQPTAVQTDGLLALRYMVEGVGREPLRDETVSRIRETADRYLDGGRSHALLYDAIDIAIALGDPERLAVVEAIAADRGELEARGITDSRYIERLQAHAAARLAGEPAEPRCCMWGG